MGSKLKPRESILRDKPVLGWVLYDWGNSAFATTVMAGFFPVFFKQFWSTGVEPTVSTARLGAANSLAGVMVALAAPVLGAMADRGILRKKFLVVFACIGIAATISLFWIGPGRWPAAMLVYILAVIGFSGGNLFYDSLIVTIGDSSQFDTISSLGYAAGYLGGGLLFTINVLMVLNPKAWGFDGISDATRFSFLTAGLWWGIFSVPLGFIRERPGRAKFSAVTLTAEGLKRLRITFKSIRSYRPVMIFLAAYWLYIDGVGTVIRMAVDYGMSIGLHSNHLILALLITQFVGFPSALVFAHIGTKYGARRGITICLWVYLAVTVWASLMDSAAEFFLLALLIGMVQGGIQALSRSYYARLIPPDCSGEFFGFFNMIGKFAAIFGPLLMGGVGLALASLGIDQTAAARLSILSIAALFASGFVLLVRVDEIR